MAKFEIDTDNRTIKLLDTSISLNDLDTLLKKYIPKSDGWELIMSTDSDSQSCGILLQPTSSNIYKYVEDDTNN